MATWDDVRRIALDLPGATQQDGERTTSWRVGSRAFAWERLLRRGERELLGAAAPDGPALGLRVADGGVREALVSARPEVFFSVPFYDSHPMVLLRVETAPFEELDEALTESWLCRAPRRLVRELLGDDAPPR